jgi:hypothetical protein
MTDSQIRLFALGWLKDQVEFSGDVLPRELLLDGFRLLTFFFHGFNILRILNVQKIDCIYKSDLY